MCQRSRTQDVFRDNKSLRCCAFWGMSPPKLRNFLVTFISPARLGGGAELLDENSLSLEEFTRLGWRYKRPKPGAKSKDGLHVERSPRPSLPTYRLSHFKSQRELAVVAEIREVLLGLRSLDHLPLAYRQSQLAAPANATDTTLKRGRQESPSQSS